MIFLIIVSIVLGIFYVAIFISMIADFASKNREQSKYKEHNIKKEKEKQQEERLKQLAIKEKEKNRQKQESFTKIVMSKHNTEHTKDNIKIISSENEGDKAIEKVIKRTSALIFKINELNEEFKPFSNANYSHEIGVPLYSENYVENETERYFYVKNEIREDCIAKIQYNNIASKYEELFSETLKRISTPLEVIHFLNIEPEKYQRVENELAEKMFLIKRDRKLICVEAFDVRSFGSLQDYSEIDFNFDYSPVQITSKYSPTFSNLDSYIQKLTNFGIPVKPITLFSCVLTKMLHKRIIEEKIDKYIKEIGGVHYALFSEYAFVLGCDTNSKSITISDYVTKNDKTIPVVGILENAFKDASYLKSIVIPTTIEMIGESAFSGCFQLKELYIPDSVILIGDNAFSSCLALANVSINKNTLLGHDVFSMCNMCKIEMRQ